MWPQTSGSKRLASSANLSALISLLPSRLVFPAFSFLIVRCFSLVVSAYPLVPRHIQVAAIRVLGGPNVATLQPLTLAFTVIFAWLALGEAIASYWQVSPSLSSIDSYTTKSSSRVSSVARSCCECCECGRSDSPFTQSFTAYPTN